MSCILTSSRSRLFIQETKAFSFTSIVTGRRIIRHNNRSGNSNSFGSTSTTTERRRFLYSPTSRDRFRHKTARIDREIISSSSSLAMSKRSSSSTTRNKISGKETNNMNQVHKNDDDETEKEEEMIYVPLTPSSSSSLDDILVPIHHLKYTIESTQDEIKRILLEREESNKQQKNGATSSSFHSLLSSSLVVIANNQSNGRGTNGRQWVCQEEGEVVESNEKASTTKMNVANADNLYYTCAVPMDCIQPMSMIPLLPLGVGSVVAKCIKEAIIKLELEEEEHQQHQRGPSQLAATDEDTQASTTASEKVKVKWPNDVLLDDKKVAGILIENYQLQSSSLSPSSSSWWWLIGIGVNVESYPKRLIKDKNDYHKKPRSATCIREYVKTKNNCGGSDNTNDSNSSNKNPLTKQSNGEKDRKNSVAIELGIQITKGICDLIETRMMMSSTILPLSSSPSVATEAIVNEWKSLSMEFGQKYPIRETGEVVTTINVESDGRMKVIGQDGIVRLLTVDHLY